MIGKNNGTNPLTHTKRVTLAFLIMTSFIVAIANIQFASAQRIEFIIQFGTSEIDEAEDVFADSSSGDVYIVGSTDGTLPGQTNEGGQDAFIRKYDSDGDEIWTRQFGTESSDGANGVSADSSSGDVYIVGSTDGTLPGQTNEGGQDAFIRKYDSDGDEIWTRQFGTSEHDEVRRVSADSSSGDVYIVGVTRGEFEGETNEGGFDMFVRKYNSDGDEIWTRQFGTSSDSDSATDISADSSSGDVYIVGSTDGTLPGQTNEGGQDAFIRKYDSDGDEIWTRQFGTSSRDTAHGVSVDSGDVYVAGDTLGTFPGQTNEGGQDAFIRKYDSDGDEIWTRQFGASGRDSARGVSVESSSDSVYVGGGAGGAFDGETEEIFDLFIRKYDSDGDEIWTRHFGTSEIDTARAVSTDSSGGVYMVGFTEGTFPGQTNEGGQDAFLAKIVDEDDNGDDKRKKHHDDDNDKKKHHDDDKRKKKH